MPTLKRLPTSVVDVPSRRAERFVIGAAAKVEELQGDPHALLAST
jgi:hypothetical protein